MRKNFQTYKDPAGWLACGTMMHSLHNRNTLKQTSCVQLKCKNYKFLIKSFSKGQTAPCYNIINWFNDNWFKGLIQVVFWWNKRYMFWWKGVSWREKGNTSVHNLIVDTIADDFFLFRWISFADTEVIISWLSYKYKAEVYLLHKIWGRNTASILHWSLTGQRIPWMMMGPSWSLFHRTLEKYWLGCKHAWSFYVVANEAACGK